MNLRGRIYFASFTVRGSAMPDYYREYLEEDRRGPSRDAGRARLAALLRHCRDHVPYYAELLADHRDIEDDPEAVLRRLPILTKPILRDRFEAFKSRDLARRRWRYNTSGGSTGEPARFVQDEEFMWRSAALAYAFAHWVGHDVGDPEARLWGSERDVLRGTLGLRNRLSNGLRRTTFLNAFRLTPEAMRGFAGVMRRKRPTLILAYAQALYEFAGFLERNRIEVPGVRAIVTSAGTLYRFMRERIERVFGAPVYDRYGSREVGLVAAERPGLTGKWIPPWNVWIEILDERGLPVPDGTDGEIVVTLLTNRAMPLVRYRIGDRGALAPGEWRGGRVLTRLTGRNVDAFRRRDGTVVDGEYFTHMVYYRDWIEKFQFVQTSYEEVVLRIVSHARDRQAYAPVLEEMGAQAKRALGADVALRVEWVDEIQPMSSGKYRYTISELPPG